MGSLNRKYFLFSFQFLVWFADVPSPQTSRLVATQGRDGAQRSTARETPVYDVKSNGVAYTQRQRGGACTEASGGNTIPLPIILTNRLNNLNEVVILVYNIIVITFGLGKRFGTQRSLLNGEIKQYWPMFVSDKEQSLGLVTCARRG